MRPFLACLSIAFLAACGSADPGASDQSETPEPALSEASEPTGDAPMEPADVAGDSPVILQSDGIGVIIDSDSPAPLPFDSDEQTVLTALETALGAPTGDEQLDECGAGPLRAVSWDGFTAFFSDTGFAGWYVQEPQPATVSTAPGVALGTTLEELQGLIEGVTVQQSTIGTEWAGGGISGTLTEDSPAGTVDVMWAGANCIAR